MAEPDADVVARHLRMKQIFVDALEVPKARRRAFIAAACGGDEALRREIIELLWVDGEADQLLDEPLDGSEALAELSGASETHLGPFRLLESGDPPSAVIGRGGMGVVYRAERDGRIVALKVLAAGALLPEIRARFQLEGQILQRLDHPGIARILDVGEASGPGGITRPWIAMELVEGRRLLDHAKEHDLSVEARLQLVADVSEAVQHAHARGIVHRDLKPSNILVRADGQPVVLDFGIARLLVGDERPTEQHTRTGQLVGTPQYMSPEQVQADPAGVGPPGDVYSLGVILFELLTGRVPYEANSISLTRAIVSILTSEPEPLGRLVPALRGPTERIVAQALEKEPRHRYVDAGELGADLRRRLSGRPVRAHGPGLARRIMRWSRRRQRLAAAVAVLVGLAALVGALLLGARLDVPRQQVLATYREAETLVSESIPLLYERERNAENMRQAIDRLTRARILIGEVPPLAHRDILVRRLEKDLGTAYMLLGEMTWDVGSARQAVLTLEHAFTTPYDTARAHLADQQVPQLGEGRVPSSELLGLLAGAHLSAYRMWGEAANLNWALGFAQRNLEANRQYQSDMREPVDARRARLHLTGYAFNSIAEIVSELARFRSSPALAREATVWSDSAWQWRDGFRHDWAAFGSLLFERGRAFLTVAELERDRAALDSATVYLAACADYRGPDRPRIHAETREMQARLAFARARLEPARRAEHLRTNLAELEAAHDVLSRTPATRAQLAWLRAERSKGFVELALALHDVAALDSARALLQETDDAFPPTSLPRHASFQWLRRGRLQLATHRLGGGPETYDNALDDLAHALSLAQSRRDTLVIGMVDDERRHLPRR